MLIAVFQIIAAALLIALILLQERSAGLSGIFGGAEGGYYHTKRGLEKLIYRSSIARVIAFAALAVAQLIR
ncbi:MAG: preprotein translocase subunit SecG [Candidatus Liptonbacteria bacterium]|nr:preprotein translocase subunit SecG [Candidatus Liptonbacteria bacterium]